MNERFVLGAIVTMLIAFPIAVSAQGTADGTAPADGTLPQDAQTTKPGQTTPVADPAPAQGSTPAQSAQTPTPTPSSASGAGASAPASGTPSSAGGASGTGQPSAGSSYVPTQGEKQLPEPTQINLGTATAETVVTPSGGSYAWAIVLGLALAIVPFGFFAAAWMRKKEPTLSKEEETKNRCLDIEHLMKDKLRELTDLKAMAKEKTVEMGKELMRDLVTGTKTGDLLVRIEKAEEQYNKLKKLFEECQIDIDRYTYKGVLIENSLLDKEILKQVRVIRSRDVGEWKLHDIHLSKKQIEEIQKNIVDTKWFFHLWEPGKDTVTVVFKDALFDVRHSDRSTWQEAIKHGLTRGIPQEQLNFEIVQ